MDLVHLDNVKNLPPLTFVLGGAASGKSLISEMLINNSGLDPTYIATGRIWDEETKVRVDVHKERRDDRWTTIEAPIDVASALAEATSDQAVLIDCATMWLTNLVMDERDIPEAQAELFEAIQACAAPVVLVSNEVGQGIVPENALARRFRDVQGRFNLRSAEAADVVINVVAGLPLALKGKFT
ncbi:MAG: bifunctional adenosylcobinamide kinase/adenosylcobinamide-phosphate guanylyltransferase [Rhodobacteraceae bacterium]|nr:bifunctional adenosylcobinamide kinase/adenosylcobinamide-phosphate guanylyltransferase [Paracoccaceae bacterium]